MNQTAENRYLSEAVSSIPKGNNTAYAAWKSPSNIALVKYWGKFGGQIPKNPSLSFSLSESLTEMILRADPHSGATFGLEYLFEGERKPEFEKRIRSYLESLLPYFPFLKGFKLKLKSSNTFPHSSGIASSASSMSALALCLCTLEEKILGRKPEDEFFKKASYISRLGSGSACRSVYGGYASWGKTLPGAGIEGSDEYASPLEIPENSVFKNLCDAVLIVSPARKSVSSSDGHAAMESHPYADARFKQALDNHAGLIRALKNEDIGQFIRITEEEALGLHALMMSSDPGFVLLEPGSIEIVKAVRNFRQRTGAFLTFTIDAGPNIHLIYPAGEQEMVRQFVEDELLQFCHKNKWIDDRMGGGPLEISI